MSCSKLQAYSTVAKFATVQKEEEREVEREIEFYNLDVIISIGYREKFRGDREANKLLEREPRKEWDLD